MSDYGPRYRHGGYVGGKEQPLHYIWRTMLARCHNKNAKDFCRYGAKGIRVCKRWYDYKNFAADMGPHPGNNLTIDRKNNSRGYSPSNCRWADAKTQGRNKSNNKFYRQGDLVLTQSEWAERLGISRELANWRMKTWGTFEKGQTWQLLNPPSRST